jgi:hypothetical protein
MPGPFAQPGVWQPTALRAVAEAFEGESIVRAESKSEFTADVMSICLGQLGEALSPDAVPELRYVKATTHLGDPEGLTIPAAEPAGLYT